ncbi:Eco57I restriction-modification methylase domain-containing protein [Vibrio cyclitrophicus]
MSGYSWDSLEYLRFTKEESADSEQKAESWKPAAGGFEKWPEHLSELKTLDPCCGSGHFLVAVFLMLVPMRMQLEGLSEKQAVDAVLRDNIHGLELDQRCVELAAFALALEAWRYPNAGGYRALPELQLACSGMSITEAQKEWKDLAKGDEALTDAIAWMQHTFKDAPTLGSLINPKIGTEDETCSPWALLEKAIERTGEASGEAKATAQGLALAARLLSIRYHWVVTNVPYLARGKQSDLLKEFCENNFFESKNDLATVFLERCLELAHQGGSVSTVLPQNWLFLTSYKKLRNRLLTNESFNYIGLLGAKGFQTPMWDFNVQLLNIIHSRPNSSLEIKGVDVTLLSTAVEKSMGLIEKDIKSVNQIEQFDNPDCRVSFDSGSGNLMSELSSALNGLHGGDSLRFRFQFWEMPRHELWTYLQNTVDKTSHFSGRSQIFYWKDNGDFHRNNPKSRIQGEAGWGKQGIAVSMMGDLPCTLHSGETFDISCSPIIPVSESDLEAMWCFCESQEYALSVRQIDQALKVTNATLVKVPFDIDKWKAVAQEKYPNGLPLPYSDDATQWIFHGHPCASVIWDDESKTTSLAQQRQDEAVLQVAVARLLGYQWPAELDPEMDLAPEMRHVMKKNADFAGLIDDDGIVCIPAVRGEKTAAKRLEAILHKAYGDEWTSSVEQNLLKAVKAKDLESWLRDKFFDQHCKLFQHRPFIWQVWDGLKDGFSALVNYHKLDYKGLERLIYTYLDDWISTQKRDLADGKDGADIRLTAAENLKTQLEEILAGEKGLDIFVRWKPLEEQPIGWNPDLNDGVRLNIRPFMLAKDVGKKGAGVLRGKPNIHWKKDRGTDVASAPWFDLGPVYGEKEGSRINDHHLTLAEKKAAREQAND